MPYKIKPGDPFFQREWLPQALRDLADKIERGSVHVLEIQTEWADPPLDFQLARLQRGLPAYRCKELRVLIEELE